MTNFSLLLKKAVIPTLITLSIPASAAGGYLLHWYPTRDIESQISGWKEAALNGKKRIETLETDNAKLKTDYTSLEGDRNNILTQTGLLIQDKNRLVEVEDKYKALADAHDTAMKQSKKLEEYLKENLNKLKTTQNDIEAKMRALETENDALRGQAVSIGEVRANLDNQIKDLQTSVGTMEKELEKNRKYKEKYEKLSQEHKSLRKQKSKISGDLKNLPKKFSEVSHQNKALIKETASMHYNLGNFYVENNRFDRAIEEYKKAIDLNPHDSKAHFNLGYIYSEEFENYPKAAEYFRKFLGLSPDDESADWARNYLMSEGTYRDAVPKS